MADKAGQCPLCGRQCALTLHHLIPKKLHRRNFFQKHYTREQRNQSVMICRDCHNAIHRFYDEKTLARDFASLKALRADEALARHFLWLSRQRVSH